jgi:hypothetical protein
MSSVFTKCVASIDILSLLHNIPFLETVSLAYLYFFHGVRLSSLDTAATVWPVIPAPDDKRWWLWSSLRNANWQGKPKYSEKTCPSITLPTTNPTWPDPGSNPGRRGGKPATNRLSYCTAYPYLNKRLKAIAHSPYSERIFEMKRYLNLNKLMWTRLGFRFSHRWLWKLSSSGVKRLVV